MARAQVPQVLSAATSLQSTGISTASSEVILRARSSNAQAISCNVTFATESDPGSDGSNAVVLFPGEELRIPTVNPMLDLIQVKRIIFNSVTGLAAPTLELIRMI